MVTGITAEKHDSFISPVGDGTVIMEFSGKELIKGVSKTGEEAKVALRNIRRDALDKFKAAQKKSEITEDELADGEDQIQKLTDKMIAKVDKAVEEKTAEIMTV